MQRNRFVNETIKDVWSFQEKADGKQSYNEQAYQDAWSSDDAEEDGPR